MFAKIKKQKDSSMSREKCHIQKQHYFWPGKVLYDQFIVQRFFSTVFVAFMFLPLFMNLFLPFRINLESTEKRVYALKPELKFSNLSSFPQTFEAYYNDHFPLRDFFIRWNSIIMVKFLNVSPVPDKVLLGKKGWLFYIGDGALDNYRRVATFSEEELKNIKNSIEIRNVWLRNQGIAYYLIFVPEKHTMYPEFMPDFIKPKNNALKFDQVVEYLRKNSTVKLIDVKEILFAEKKEIDLYRHYDSHWNNYGAFIASRSLLYMVANDFPVITSLIPSPNDFSIDKVCVDYGDLISMLGIGNGIFKESVFYFAPKNKNSIRKFNNADFQNFQEKKYVVEDVKKARLPRMLMFRDSFANNMIPYLSHCFSRSVYVWEHSLALALIISERPDIVVDEIGERNLQPLSIPQN